MGVLLLLAVLLGSSQPAGAQAPLFSFVQISDSQPNDEADWAAFQRVLDAIVASGSTGALIPQPIDFVPIAGDLVSHAENQSEWVRFVDTVDASLTANAIPYRAVPGNHDEQNSGPPFGSYEFFIGDSGVWDTDSGTVVGQNGPSVYTGWKGLRIIGFNNSNGAHNQISAADLSLISAKVVAAAAAGENPDLLGHHPHDDEGVIPLASVLENTALCCYAHGHSGSPGAKQGLNGIANPYIWRFNTNSTFEEQAILYYEAYATELRVYVIELVQSPTALPTPETIPLAFPLQPVVLNRPVADFTATPLSGVAPLAVSFSDTSTGNPTSWLWTFGDGTTSTLRSPSRTYTVPGVYDVTLRATNSLGSDTVTRSGYVQVASPLPPVADFSGTPLSGFAPLQVAFSDLSTGAPTSWLWSFGDGTTSTLKNPSKTYTNPGSYQVTLQVTSAAGTNARVRAGYVNAASGKAVTAAADAKTSLSNPTTNYGSASDLRVRGGSGVYRSFLRFDVSGLTKAVVRAKLRLYVDDGSDDGGTVYSVSSAWSEGAITWNTAPVLGAALSNVGAVVTGTWIEVDVTPAINGNGTFAFCLAKASSNSAYYRSRESAHAPQLMIETAP